MAIFRYKAVDADGKTVRAQIQADSADRASEKLVEKGLTPLSVVAGNTVRKSAGAANGHVRTEDIILFTKQFCTMLRAGVPILRAFEILAKESESKVLQRVCESVVDDIRAGASLHGALQKHTRIFSPLYRNMVRAGERSGTLTQVLDRLIYVVQHEHKVRTEVRSVLQYPVMVLVVLFGAMGILLTTVIPRFAGIYAGAGITLPLPTRICIALSDLLRLHWVAILLGVVILIVGGIVARKTETGRYWQDRAMLALPFVGDVVVKAALSRFASVFSILQASGISMLESIDILSGTLANSVIVRHFRTVQSKVEHGQGLSKPLAAHPYFTPMFVSMVAIGEETGKLDEMLREIANHYDTEVEFATKRLTAAIGPMLIIMLAAVVGFFALAVYLPMWDIARVATGMDG